MRARRIGVTFVAVGFSLALGVGSASSQVRADEGKKQKRINTEILQYQEAHPGDLVGLDRLAYKYTGKHLVASVSGHTGLLTAEVAQRAASDSADLAAASACTGGIPRFTVTIEAVPLYGPPDMRRVTGRWNFPDCWAGQRTPVDIASLAFNMADCFRMGGHNISTYSVTGRNTYRGTLRTANVGSKAPIWNVADYTTNFEMQADHGGAGVTISDYCGGSHQVGAAFDYEANAGGRVLSVSAGWGGLGVSYSGSPMTRQLGTTPVYFNL